MLTFITFDVEDYYFDYLELRDGDSAYAPLLDYLSGNDIPDQVISTGSNLWLRWVEMRHVLDLQQHVFLLLHMIADLCLTDRCSARDMKLTTMP